MGASRKGNSRGAPFQVGGAEKGEKGEKADKLTLLEMIGTVSKELVKLQHFANCAA